MVFYGDLIKMHCGKNIMLQFVSGAWTTNTIKLIKMVLCCDHKWQRNRFTIGLWCLYTRSELILDDVKWTPLRGATFRSFTVYKLLIQYT